MNEEETDARTRFYNSLADLLDVIRQKIEDNQSWINIFIEKEEE